MHTLARAQRHARHHPTTTHPPHTHQHVHALRQQVFLFQSQSQDRTEYVLWQKSGDQTQQWHHAQLTLPQTSLPYSLVFEATRGSNAASDVAVDDVNVTSEVCPGISLYKQQTSHNCYRMCYTHTRARTHARTHTHTHTRTHARTLTHRGTRTRAHTHARAH